MRGRDARSDGGALRGRAATRLAEELGASRRRRAATRLAPQPLTPTARAPRARRAVIERTLGGDAAFKSSRSRASWPRARRRRQRPPPSGEQLRTPVADERAFTETEVNGELAARRPRRRSRRRRSAPALEARRARRRSARRRDVQRSARAAENTRWWPNRRATLNSGPGSRARREARAVGATGRLSHVAAATRPPRAPPASGERRPSARMAARSRFARRGGGLQSPV